MAAYSRHLVRMTALAAGSAAAIACGLPATAAERLWYVAASATRSDPERPKQTIANAPTSGATLQVVNAIDSDWGWQVAVGRKVGPVRLAAEVGRTQNDSSSYTAISPLSITLPQKGKNDVTRYMANVAYDLPLPKLPVQLYVGGGVGAADVHVTTFAAPARAPTIPPSQLIYASQTRFAYQLMAGAAFPITDRVSLTAQYRWLDTGTLKGKDSRGEKITRSIKGSNCDFGLRFAF